MDTIKLYAQWKGAVRSGDWVAACRIATDYDRIKAGEKYLARLKSLLE